MEPKHILALDPGGTTGWAYGLISDGKMGVKSGQEMWNHVDLYDSLTQFNPHIIVCERFDYRKLSANQGAELISREYIGVITLWARQKQRQLVMQMPSEGVGGYYKGDQLKKHGVYLRGKPHANDAMRHLLQWYTFKEGYQYNKEGFYLSEV